MTLPSMAHVRPQLQYPETASDSNCLELHSCIPMPEQCDIASENVLALKTNIPHNKPESEFETAEQLNGLIARTRLMTDKLDSRSTAGSGLRMFLSLPNFLTPRLSIKGGTCSAYNFCLAVNKRESKGGTG